MQIVACDMLNEAECSGRTAGRVHWTAGMTKASSRVFLSVEVESEAVSVMPDADFASLYDKPFTQDSHERQHRVS